MFSGKAEASIEMLSHYRKVQRTIIVFRCIDYLETPIVLNVVQVPYHSDHGLETPFNNTPAS